MGCGDEDAQLAACSSGGQSFLRQSLHSAPRFPKGGRTHKLGDKPFESLQLGRASPGPAYDTWLGLGAGQRQGLARHQTAPACTISGRGDRRRQEAAAAALPGPGSYRADFPTVGQPVAVARGPSAPAVHIGRQPRFPASPAAPRLGPDGVRCCDPLLTPPVSFLGRDAPSWTFHGGRPRAAAPLALLGAAATGGAADAPSDVAAPAPGAYAGAAAPSAFGPQVSSEAASAPAVRLPRAGRDAFLKQALSKAEEKVLLCRASQGCRLPQKSSLGRQVLSAHRTTGSCSFGTGGRFSDREALGRRPSTAAARGKHGSSRRGSSN